MFTFDCLVHNLRSRMTSNDTHYSVLDQANIPLGLCFPKSNLLPRQVLHIRLHPLLLAWLVVHIFIGLSQKLIEYIVKQHSHWSENNNYDSDDDYAGESFGASAQYCPRPCRIIHYSTHNRQWRTCVVLTNFSWNTQYINTQLQKAV